MKAVWDEKRISSLFEIKPSKSELKNHFKNTDEVSFLPMEDLAIASKNVEANKKRKLGDVVGSYTYFGDNDVLLAKITPCFENGKLGIARKLKNGIGFGSSEYFVFRSQGSVIPEYLFYFFSREDFRKEGKASMTGAVGHKRVSKEFIENYLLPFPKSLSEQQRIVAILDETFAAIATVKENAERNLQNAKELFDSYLQSVFANKGEDWEEKTLNELCEVKDGTHDSPGYIKEGIPFVTQKNIRPEGLSFENTKFIAEADHAKFYKRSNVAFGDILISMIGANRGMACIVDDKRIFSIKNVGLIKASEKINKYFLLFYLKSPFASRYVADKSNGGAQEFVGLTALRAFPIPYPPRKEQETIVKKLDALSSECKKLEAVYQKKLDDLEELKKVILQKAFSGELKTNTIKDGTRNTITIGAA
jgi:type I restriction enzyme S subunit